MYPTLALISLLILVSLALFPLARRSGMPLLLIVLAVGMLAGEDGLGGFNFDDFDLAFNLGSVALAVILLAGGLETDKGIFRSAGLPALILAFPGVIITGGIVGGVAHLILGMPLIPAFLLGAVLAPTDAAATFMLIQHGGLKLRERLKNTLMLESGFNDPAAITLTIILTSLVGASLQTAQAEWMDYVTMFSAQVVFGAIGGLAGGKILAEIINRLSMPVGTYPVLVIQGGILVFALTTLVGGSGFLAVYIAGIALRNGLKIPLERIANFAEGLQWLSQVLLFLTLGLLVTPSDLPDAIGPALICSAVLIFLARPAAVFLGVGAMKFNLRELTFLSWVGLRGAAPILFAIYPVVTPGPVTPDFFNIVFVVVVLSLSLQGFTAGWLGRILKLDKE
jgi:cell volume regulation protein A